MRKIIMFGGKGITLIVLLTLILSACTTSRSTQNADKIMVVDMIVKLDREIIGIRFEWEPKLLPKNTTSI